MDFNLRVCFALVLQQEEMNAWIGKINSSAGGGDVGSSSAGRSQTMPASVEAARKDEQKKRSFFTLGKKK